MNNCEAYTGLTGWIVNTWATDPVFLIVAPIVFIVAVFWAAGCAMVIGESL